MDKPLYCSKFPSNFHQPLTTTHQYTNNQGIVFALKSAGDYLANRVPKCLSISWLSGDNGEDERVIHRFNVNLRICNVIESNDFQEHCQELKRINHKII